MTDISIVIPVFNAEKYLKRCLQSVISALSKANGVKGEILLVDNDSKDGSVGIIKDYAKKYSFISVLQCHTPGAAAVRNFGCKKAKGEYVWFIDADDTIKKQSISVLLERAREKDADIVMMGAERIHGDGETDLLTAVSEHDSDYKSRFIRYGMGPWQVIFRRKWWDENGFSFREGIMHEDMELMSSLILYTDRFASVDETLYYYYQNSNSVLHKEKFTPHIFDIFPALEGLYGRFKEKKAEEKYHDELEWFFIWNLLIDSAKDFSKFPEGKEGLKRTRKMMKEYFPGWRKNRFLKQKPLKLRIRVRLNYYKK